MSDTTLDKIFADAAGYRIPEDSRILHIDYDQYGILTKESEQNVIATRFTYTCAGVALRALDNSGHIALLHLYSDADHIEAGEAAIHAHVTSAWGKFVEILDPKTKFHATAFGGRKYYEGTKPGKPDQADIDQFFRLRRECAEIRESEEYKQSSIQEKMNMTQRYTSYAEEADTGQLNSRLSLYVSGLINDKLYELLQSSGFITSLTDMRYMDTPHDAVIERDTGRIVIGRTQREKLEEQFVSIPKTGAQLEKNISVIMPWEHDIPG